MNLYQHAKKHTISSFCSREVVDLKTLNLSDQEHCGPYLSNQIFPKFKICAGTNFYYITYSNKNNGKYFNKFKSFIIGPFFAHFPHFGSKKKWKSNSALSGIISNGFLTQCQIFKKLDDPIPIKRLDGQTDIPILIGPFRLSPRVQQYRGRDNL